MGAYTEHWNQHKKRNVRGMLYVLLLLVVGLPVTALIPLGIEQLTGDYPVYIQLALLVVWLVVFTMMIIRFSRATCPRCGAQYTHGRGLVDCPQCGLRMLQEDP
jgi:tellurite resistance protein TehA-like permease